MTWRLALLLALAQVAAGAAAFDPSPTNWRQMATANDRERLRGWRTAWVKGLAVARAGDGAGVIAADPALFDPDRSLPVPLPPPGPYRCRAFKLGAAGVAHGFTARPWASCRVEAQGAGVRLSKLDGAQRPTGLIFADTDVRAIFLGTMMLGDETRPLGYGRDQTRDMAGVVERIGPARWRIVLPYPRFESVIDVVELVPAAS